MPKLTNAHPKLRHHQGSGQACVDFGQGEIYLGPHGSKQARREYDRLIAEWLANGRRPVTPAVQVTVAEIMHAFIQHAKQHYRRADGTPTSELDNFKDALRPLKRLYAMSRAVEFGPLALRAVRDEMIRLGWSRTHINRQIGRVRHVFKWAASRELLPVTVHQALSTVEGLKAGRSGAKESKPVRPVADAAVEAVLPLVSRQVQALVKLQRLTGMRPGEACSMRGADLTTGAGLWEYRPSSHKTQHHGEGHERVIVLGKQARAIVEEFLKLDPQAYLFSPADSDAERRAKQTEERDTPLSCSNIPGSNQRRRPNRKPGQRYTVESYCHAIWAACDKAFPPPDRLARQRVPATGRKAKSTRWETRAEWRARLGEKQWAELRRWVKAHRWHPHMLRHSFATEARRKFGLEVAQVLLGHKTLTVTQVYAEKNVEAARQVMSQVG